MRVVTQKMEADTRIDCDTELRGMIVGNVVVSPGTVLVLHGMIVGTLTLEKDSNVYLHGMVVGDAANNGGDLQLRGTVTGTVSSLSGNTVVDQNARVGALQK
jgi:cytoskeletal protein CcmA (bactofilin family)